MRGIELYIAEGKGFFGEGSLRVPVVAYWPGVTAPRTDPSVISLMDLFPTFAAISGADIPTDRHIDGKDLSSILFSNASRSPHNLLTFYHESTLFAVRHGPFKIYFYEMAYPTNDELRANCRGTYPIHNWMQGEFSPRVKLSKPRIYNVEEDPREFYELPVEDYAEILQNVEDLIAQHEKTLNDIPEPLLGDNFHSNRVVPCCNYPYCVCWLLNQYCELM